MKFTKPQYFYHATESNWGSSKVLVPRNWGSNRMDEEPKINRICVSKKISGCLVSVHFCHRRVNIYRTKQKIKACYAWGVSDVSATYERWIIVPTEFIFVGHITKKRVLNLHKVSGDIIFGSDDFIDLCKQKEIRKQLAKELPEYFVKKDNRYVLQF